MTHPNPTSLDQPHTDAYGPGHAPTLLEARALQPARGEIRVAVVHTYTLDILDPWLEQAAALEDFGAGAADDQRVRLDRRPFSLADRFGHSGIVGLALVKHLGATAPSNLPPVLPRYRPRSRLPRRPRLRRGR